MRYENMGVAGTKNWDVKGMRRAIIYNIGIASLKGNLGVRINVSQNMAFNIWRRYADVLEKVNVCWRRRAIVSLGDSDLSKRPTAAINACEMVRKVRGKTLPVREGILTGGIIYADTVKGAPHK
jgi:hypothetical protein